MTGNLDIILSGLADVLRNQDAGRIAELLSAARAADWPIDVRPDWPWITGHFRS